MQVENAAQAVLALEKLSHDEVARAAMADAARTFAAAHRGATERTVAVVREVLEGRVAR